MLSQYIAKIRRHLPRVGAERRAARWAARVFHDVVAPPNERRRVLALIADHASMLTQLARELDVDAARRTAFATTLLNVCAWVDTGRVTFTDAPLRSYVDISVQVATFRRVIAYIADQAPVAGGGLPLTAMVVEQFPDSRPALLVYAELLIEQSRLDDAIAVIERALRIQAVCPSAQQLLGCAHAARRTAGESTDERNGLNYDLSDKFCPMPFTHLATGFKGDTFVCCCPAWVPYPVGNVLTADSANDVWNSRTAAEVRRSIHDGDFRYCSRTLCSYIAAQKLPAKQDVTDPTLRRYIEQRTVVLEEAPQMVQLNHDPTCNLACPSCRVEIIAATAEEQDTFARATDRVILPLLKTVNGDTYISGGGEAFASRHYRAILSALNRTDYPGLSVYLITNGLLATPQRWREFSHLPEMIDILSVSIDAAKAETFERLRRPARWAPLMKNLEFMAEMRRANQIRHFQINFVVQEENFREIPAFAALGARLGVDEIWFQRLTNYGAYDQATFTDTDVTSPRHPLHPELLGILRDPILKHPRMNLEMLMPLLPEVVASDLQLPLLYGFSRRTDERPYRGNVE